MSMIKHALEEVSVRMGHGGEITDEVVKEFEAEQALLADRSHDERQFDEQLERDYAALKQVMCRSCHGMKKLTLLGKTVPATDWMRYGFASDIGCICPKEK